MKINLGCGYNKKDGFLNIDIREELRPDIVADISDSLPFKDNTISQVMALDFLEHIPVGKTIGVIEEIYRVLENNGILFHFTPSTDGRGAFQDPTHLSFWNKNSWLYYVDDRYRNLYGIKAKFSGSNEDVITDKRMKIVHTKGVLRALKSDEN